MMMRNVVPCPPRNEKEKGSDLYCSDSSDRLGASARGDTWEGAVLAAATKPLHPTSDSFRSSIKSSLRQNTFSPHQTGSSSPSHVQPREREGKCVCMQRARVGHDQPQFRTCRRRQAWVGDTRRADSRRVRRESCFTCTRRTFMYIHEHAWC